MFVIRKASRADVPAILGLVKELATYEREPDAVLATEADLLRDGFGDHPAFEVLLAEKPNLDPEKRTSAVDTIAHKNPEMSVIGFAFYFFSYSTWVGRKCLYLEDLFVRPAHRGEGAGVALMRELARVAVATECRRFVWQVLDWNEPAIAFYERLGAKLMREWLTVRIEGDTLSRLAAGADAEAADRC